MLVTSDHEGSPNTVKEAICCDVPVVTVDAGDAREQISDVAGCRLVERDPDAIATALEETLARVGQVDGSSARSRLALDVVAGRVVEVYSEAVRRKLQRS